MRDPFLSRDWIGRVTEPVLVVHGEQDTTIRIMHGRGLYALANPPKRFVAMPASDHNSLIADGLYRHIWRFLDEQAPARGAPPQARPTGTKAGGRESADAG
jgi:hypothetical protein